MKRIISILLENKPGALARVVGLFHQRGYNIESLNVGPVFDGTYSRMTVTSRGSENDVEQITKQINKIINHITTIAFDYIKPYLYTIMAILITLFIMNCLQFYYYIKLIILKDKTLLTINLDDMISKN